MGTQQERTKVNSPDASSCANIQASFRVYQRREVELVPVGECQEVMLHIQTVRLALDSGQPNSADRTSKG